MKHFVVVNCYYIVLFFQGLSFSLAKQLLLAPPIGFEPITLTLTGCRSTIELQEKNVDRVGVEPTGCFRTTGLQSALAPYESIYPITLRDTSAK